MSACTRIRPALMRLAEGEAGPDEALAAARHLSTCTGCRIVLAREQRLVEMLDGVPDPVDVEDEFAARVMRALPEGPPPRRARSGLRLAGWVGVLTGAGAGAAWAAAQTALAPVVARLAVPLGLDGADQLAGHLAIPVQWLTLVAVGLGGAVPSLPDLPALGVLLGLALPIAAGLMLLPSAALLLAVRRLGRSR